MTEDKLRVAVLGAGNWGTTLADLAASNGHEVRLWTRDADVRDEINQRQTNRRGVPGLLLSPGVRAACDLRHAVTGAELVLVVIPAQSFREVARALGDVLGPEQHVLHATKGLELGSHRRMSQILAEETCARQIGVLAGPNLAPEIAARKHAGTVIASAFPELISLGRRALGSDRLMVFAGDDVLGVELASALKNVVAIAAGMADEMKLGENAKSFLVTRGLLEIARVATAMGARRETFGGLAGIGDLMVTCQSPISRNHRVGAALARGLSREVATAELGMVAEGVPTSVVARELAAAHGVDAPLLVRVHRVLYESLSPEEALRELMSLPAGRDVPRSHAR